ncbi:acylphosphatase [Candidatus Uhrbacteria bacterium CG_4_9_14_3_um_filter_50_9]|uniref:acylphosphatase n=1 Tax=Candidatus Uhrbacteria bacterium CG_4_9_14_3_um_filter_50_9 TaxID=1975035 RepID=A0A2M7XC57_9BACT|nr:MAG: acylphosphatase [Candidatus Uhrbacteria bacterium CG_4_9_14_3_um_filter_50_9]
MATLDVHIFGYVQGTGYRYSAKQQADRLGITGWIRNLDDGTVKARIHGSDDDVQVFLDWCKQGPVLAKVERVETSDVSSFDADSFSIHY